MQESSANQREVGQEKQEEARSYRIEDDKGNGNNYDDGHDEEDRQAYI